MKRTILASAIAAAVVVAYAPALRAPFEFDDLASVPGNTSIRRLWPPSIPLSPPANTTVAGRPVVNYSLALNYALNEWLGVDQRVDPYGPNKAVGYRLANILIHLTSGLLLFAIVRRTLRGRGIGDEWSMRAERTAAVVTALWLLHPLQSEAVNYVVQRTELIVSACYLATLYASIRAWDATRPRARTWWRALAVIVCLLGMGSKEVMITAPLIVMLYDRAFRVASWKALLSDRDRFVFYIALLATTTWTIVLVSHNSRFGTVGFRVGIPWYQYVYSQAWAILHYLRLALWPDQLTFDYGQRPISGWRGLPGLIALCALGIATVLAWVRLGRWSPLAFLGAWFFLVLAPSSSFVPIATEIAAERRVYLAFAAVVVASVAVAPVVLRGAVGRSAERWSTAGWVALLVPLTAATFVRSRTYANPEALWRDTVRKAPENPRAYNNLASTLFFTVPPRLAEAKELYWKAIALDSTYLPPWVGLASIAVNEEKFDEAKWLLEQALSIDREYADAVDQVGRLYLRMGQPAKAVPYLERYASAYPTDNSLAVLASAYMQAGQLEAAMVNFQRALELNPSRLDALRDLGGILVENGRGAEAVPLLERATKLDSRSGLILALLSLAYAESGRGENAGRTALAAVSRAKSDPVVALLAGRAMLAMGLPQDAEQFLSEAVRLNPTNPEALTRLGFAKRALGNVAEAERLFRQALTVDSTYDPARAALRGSRPK